MYNDPIYLLKHKTQLQCYDHKLGELYFKERKNCYIIAGDPNIKDSSQFFKNANQVFLDFIEGAKENNSKAQFCGYYFSSEFSSFIQSQQLSFKFYEVGVSQKVIKKNYKISGHDKRDVRRALNFGSRELSFIEIKHSEKISYYKDIISLEKKWLKSKMWLSFFKNKIEFILSSPSYSFEKAQNERWFVVQKNNQTLAFISLLKNNANNYYLDHMFYDPSENRKCLDYLMSKTVQLIFSEKNCELSLGLSPFKNIQPKTKTEYLFWLQGKTNFLYNSTGLFRFKKKYATHSEKRYLMVSGNGPKIKQLFSIFKESYPYL